MSIHARRLIAPLAALGLLAAAAPAVAHHSGAMFDHRKTVVLKGTLKSFSYQSPHAWISIIGGPDGSPAGQQWDIETVAPALLARFGLNRDTLKPGDPLTITVNPLRDGRRGGSMVAVTDKDGRVYGAGASPPPR